MPSPLSSTVYWVSFMSFIALRRESLLRHIEDNQSKLLFDKHYIDLFFNELGIAFMSQGIQAMRVPYEKTFYSGSLTAIMLKLRAHSGSDQDVWAGITAGCFRDTSIPRSACTGVVTNWWSTAPGLPTFDSVVREWENALLETAGCTTPSWGMQTAEEAEMSLRDIIEALQGDISRTETMMKATQEEFACVEELSVRWDHVLRRN
ncbi:hypothetical protein NMY22_g5370 [Coprinellus aureogranulatus]|nr:hypothetical protein NMY22_g5370 [Coprinellus aureogranulatus]